MVATPEPHAQACPLGSATVDGTLQFSVADLFASPEQSLLQHAPATSAIVDGTLQFSVADLFASPEQSLLQHAPSTSPKRGRHVKKSVATTAGLRQSKRQAASRLKHLMVEQRANIVLCRRLGYIKDDLSLAKQAIQDFIASFKGLMPQFIIAALTALFRLDDDDICSATAALIRMGGQDMAGVADAAV
jgi:hypothetical protein